MSISYPFRVVTDGLGFPEGPVVLPDGTVIVCEIKSRCLTAVRADGTKEVVARLDGAPNGGAVGKDGALYICNNGDGFAWGDPGGVTQPVGGNPGYSGGRIERVDLATGAAALSVGGGTATLALSAGVEALFLSQPAAAMTSSGSTTPR